MKWPVANTKIKREKTIKNWKMAIKRSIFKIFKNCLKTFFSCVIRRKYDQKMKNGPKNVNFQNFEKCFEILFHFVLRNYHTQKYDSTTKKCGQGTIPYFRLHKRDQNLIPSRSINHWIRWFRYLIAATDSLCAECRNPGRLEDPLGRD